MRAGYGSRLRRSICVSYLAGVGLLGFGLAIQARAANEEAIFKLREVSAFTFGGSDFVTGQRAIAQERPFAQVRAYPKFVSGKPVYGSVSFLEQKGGTNSPLLFYFAADESRGTGKGYDQLYFDLNRDLNLNNDPVVPAQKQIPEGAKLNWGQLEQQVCFEPVSVKFDCGSAGIREILIMPRLVCSKYQQEEYKSMLFVRTRIYEGRVKLGTREFEVRLGNGYLITGRLDQPESTLKVLPVGGDGEYRWWGGDTLGAAHKVEGLFYTFSASPMGDELTVRPYAGELGKFEVGAGARKLDRVAVRGSLRATNCAVAVGEGMDAGWPRATRSCEVPVGDYLPSYLTIDFGRLLINVSDNYHSEDKARDRGGRTPVYGMSVRKDKPFVLDFSNKPDVIFTSPTKSQRVRLGEQLEVKAVLIDPKLDIMIRGLDDTTRTQTKADDGSAGSGRKLSLDPTVLITRTNGEKVAEGVMPFG